MVATSSKNETVELYTTEIFGDGTRGTVIVRIKPVIPPDYFPDKSSDMKGIPIRFQTLKYPPFTYYEDTVKWIRYSARIFSNLIIHRRQRKPTLGRILGTTKTILRYSSTELSLDCWWSSANGRTAPLMHTLVVTSTQVSFTVSYSLVEF